MPTYRSDDELAATVCEAEHEGGRGCPDPLRPQGTCLGCRKIVAALKTKLRPKFEPCTMDEAGHILASAAGAECYVCRREPQKDVTYKNLAVCARCVTLGLARESMSKLNDTTDAEDLAGMAAIDRAGEYLASIDKFDLRDLSDAELKKFNAHFICGFADDMRERVSRQPPF